jgi:phage gpG-like protein
MARNFNLKATEAHFKQVLLYAPAMLGNDAVNFFLDNFKRQGWLGNRLEPWKKRKRNKKRPGRAILVDSGRLRRSIRITSIHAGTVTIGTDVPYAKAHNEGFRGVVNVKAHTRGKYAKSKVGTGKLTKKGKERMKTVTSKTGEGTVKAHTRKVNMPRRQFMGSSPYLTKQLQRRLQAELMKGLRS